MLKDLNSDEPNENKGPDLKTQPSKENNKTRCNSVDIEQPSKVVVKCRSSWLDGNDSDKPEEETPLEITTNYHGNDVRMMTPNETMLCYKKETSLQSIKMETMSFHDEDCRKTSTQNDFVADFVIRDGRPFESLSLQTNSSFSVKKPSSLIIKNTEGLIQQGRDRKNASSQKVERFKNDQGVAPEGTQLISSQRSAVNVAYGQKLRLEESEQAKEIAVKNANKSIQNNINVNKNVHAQKIDEDHVTIKHENNVNSARDNGALLERNGGESKLKKHRQMKTKAGEDGTSARTCVVGNSSLDGYRKPKISDDEKEISLNSKGNYIMSSKNKSKSVTEHEFIEAMKIKDGKRPSSAKSDKTDTKIITLDIRINTAPESKRKLTRQELDLGVASYGVGSALDLGSDINVRDVGNSKTLFSQEAILSDSSAQRNDADHKIGRRKSSANSNKLSEMSSITSTPIIEISDGSAIIPIEPSSINEENKNLLSPTQTQAIMLPVLEGAAYYDEDYFKRFERQNLAEQRELKKHFRAKIAEARKTLREARKKAQEQTVARRFDEAVRKHKEMQQKRKMRKSSTPQTPVSPTPTKPATNSNLKFTKAALAVVKEKVEMREIQKAEAQLDRAKAAKKLKERMKVEESSRPTSIKAQIRKDKERMERYEVEYLISEMRFLNMDDYATKLVEALSSKDELETTLRHQLKQKRQLAIQMAKKQKMEELARIKEEERRRKQEEKERLERERREREALELERRREEALRQREKNLKLKEMYNFTVLATDLSRSYTYSYLPALKQRPPVEEVKSKKPKIKNVKPRYLQTK